MATLFLQWVNQYKLAEIKNADKIGIPVDYHISNLSIQTRGIEIKSEVNRAMIQEETLVPIFREICQELNIEPFFPSETLWLIGNRCCNTGKHSLCPLFNMCEMVIRNRMVYDKTGKFKTMKNTEMGQLSL